MTSPKLPVLTKYTTAPSSPTEGLPALRYSREQLDALLEMAYVTHLTEKALVDLVHDAGEVTRREAAWEAEVERLREALDRAEAVRSEEAFAGALADTLRDATIAKLREDNAHQQACTNADARRLGELTSENMSLRAELSQLRARVAAWEADLSNYREKWNAIAIENQRLTSANERLEGALALCPRPIRTSRDPPDGGSEKRVLAWLVHESTPSQWFQRSAKVVREHPDVWPYWMPWPEPVAALSPTRDGGV